MQLWIRVFADPERAPLWLDLRDEKELVVQAHGALKLSAARAFRIRSGHELFCALCLFIAIGMAVGIRWGWRAGRQHDAPVAAQTPAPVWLAILALSALAM